MEITNETPSKSKTNIINKVLSNHKSCDSPFRFIPTVSTPPSRFTKILNPFEHHLIERLHLPTFSPGAFSIPTTKTEDKFKWTIDDISSLKPADIDEATVSQHVSIHDPAVESVVQEKINNFFSSKIVVPSPMSAEIHPAPLLVSPRLKPLRLDNSTQTVLTLPPILPKEVEDLLKPYCTYTESQQKEDLDLLYQQLFEFNGGKQDTCDQQSIESSPALSTGLSPIQLSPELSQGSQKRTFDSSFEMPELRDCALSPIGRSPRESRSAFKLDFSSYMSVDTSLVVPDINQLPNNSLNNTNFDSNIPESREYINNSASNWDVEYDRVSFLSGSSRSSPELTTTGTNTPHSKIFTSQRKRLSDSFKQEEFINDIEMDENKFVPRRLKTRVMEDITDAGYNTGGATLCESSTWNDTHMFASTPTKNES